MSQRRATLVAVRNRVTALRRYRRIRIRRSPPWTSICIRRSPANWKPARLAGWLSDYLVAWHGPSGNLEPEVTVWRSADQNDDTVKAYLTDC